MIYDLDGFHPVRPGSPAPVLYGPGLTRAYYNDELSRQVAVVCRTVGFEPMHWDMLMAWLTHRIPSRAEILAEIMARHASDPHVEAAAKANALTVTRADGLDWLRVILARKPGYRGEVPVWTRRALREVREERGWTNKELAVAFQMPGRGWTRMAKWVADRR